MRLFETLVPISLAVHLFWPHPRPIAIRLLPIAALTALLTHLIAEGYRWQMVPLYMLTGVVAAASLMKIRTSTDWKPIASTLTLGLLAVSTALPALLPVPRIPAPGGPYAVGTRIFEVIDDSRREIYSGRDEARRIMIQLWYPAEADRSSGQARWMEEAEVYAPAVSGQIGMPSFFLDHLALVEIPAFKNAPVEDTDQGFPVILFSHGWNGFNAQNTGQALELASHGYVVIGVQHTYGAVITVFPDGSVAYSNPAALPEGRPRDEYEAAAQILSDQWAGDLGFTLDVLLRKNQESTSPFYGRFDLSRVGVYGHSTGGGAAIQFCGTDRRCTALLGMDPFMRPVSYEVIDSGLPQPSFFMFSQRWADDTDSRNNELFNSFYPHIENPLGVIAIKGTAHYDFSDLPLLSPLAPHLGLKGPVNGMLVTGIIRDYLIAFFDETLKGKLPVPGVISDKYPEVITIK